jgi:hypothetical protein
MVEQTSNRLVSAVARTKEEDSGMSSASKRTAGKMLR